MTRFLTTAATALVLTTSAYAYSDEATSVFSDMTFDATSNINASELIGMRVYASEADIAGDATILADGEREWDDIGEINEVILTRDGTVQAVIVGVGGFLGLSEKDVAVNMSEIRFVNEEGDSGDYFLVIKATKVGIQDAPSYDYNLMTNTMDDGDENAIFSDDDRAMLTAPDVTRDGYMTANAEDLTTDDLTGARVYGANDEDVGEISELLMTDSGALDRAVIDVGGFLGLGERPVAVSLDALTIMRSENGDDFRVYIDSSQEALENQPEYEG